MTRCHPIWQIRTRGPARGAPYPRGHSGQSGDADAYPGGVGRQRPGPCLRRTCPPQAAGSADGSCLAVNRASHAGMLSLEGIFRPFGETQSTLTPRGSESSELETPPSRHKNTFPREEVSPGRPVLSRDTPSHQPSSVVLSPPAGKCAAPQRCPLARPHQEVGLGGTGGSSRVPHVSWPPEQLRAEQQLGSPARPPSLLASKPKARLSPGSRRGGGLRPSCCPVPLLLSQLATHRATNKIGRASCRERV